MYFNGRAVQGVDLRPLACWGCGSNPARENLRLSVVSVVCCQLEVSVSE